MLNKVVLDYVDDVMARVTAPDEIKTTLENELIRKIIELSENASSDEIMKKLGPPVKLAEEITQKYLEMSNNLVDNVIETDKDNIGTENSYNKPVSRHHQHPRYRGEYMRQDSNVNIKLLYIPLIQISSQVEVIRMPIYDECYFD